MRKGEVTLQLCDLLKFQEIILQCHDHPDADTISSAYGLYLYFKSYGKKVRMVYTGRDQISKSNLKLMITELRIPLEYIKESDASPDLLITVDCQYGEGNVSRLEAKHVANIDHHKNCEHEVDFSIIRETYGSCATLVYRLLQEEEFPIWEDANLMTALYYGLYMDTNAFSEVRHPIDMEMMEELRPNESLVLSLKNCNFTFHELEIAANALIRYNYSEVLRFAIVRANPCDPNLLGFISDLLLQVEGVDTSIAYCELDYGYKISVRNCNREIRSSEVVKYLIGSMGTGGGHNNKAGGYIAKSKYESEHGGMNLLGYFLTAMPKFFDSYDILDLSGSTVDISNMKLYEHLPVKYGVCQTTDLTIPGERIIIQTEHSEYDFIAEQDMYLLINMEGGVFKVSKDTFETRFQLLKKDYECNMLVRTLVNTAREKQSIHLEEHLQCCISKPKYNVYARQLNKVTKLFYNYNYSEYSYGAPGDYLVVMTEEENDVLIVKKDAFEKSYRQVQGEMC